MKERNVMQKEIKATVDLWASKFCSENDMGEDEGNALIRLFRSRQTPPTSEQIEGFKQSLSILLEKKLSKYWDLEKPDFGSSLRVLFTDYHPDRDLTEACNLNGIDPSLLPIKSITWTGPGYVKAQFGYKAEIEQIDIS